MNTQNEGQAPGTVGGFFIECLNADTNQKLAGLLEQNTGEAECREKQCADGIARNMYEVSREQVAICALSERSAGLKMSFFQKTEEGIVPITIIIPDELEDARLLPTIQVSGIFAREHVEDLLSLIKIMRFKQKPDPEPQRPHGVAPMNVHEYRPRPEAQAIFGAHISKDRHTERSKV
jgi:hypothetical protein